MSHYDNYKILAHLSRFNERNWDMTDKMMFEDLLSLWGIFKHCNPEYSICQILTECDMSDKEVLMFNDWVEKHPQYEFTKWVED